MSRRLNITEADTEALVAQFRQKLLDYQGSAKSITIPVADLYTIPKVKEKQQVLISPTAWAKMYHLVQFTNKEIAWHCLVKHIKKDTYYIYDVLVYPQKVTGTTVDTDDTAYTLWRQNLTTNVVTYLKGQGHSHVNMSVNPSGVDTGYYQDIINCLRPDAYYVFLIMNKAGNIYCQIADKKNNIFYENTDCEVQVYTSKKEKIADWVADMLDKNVQEQRVTTYTRGNATYQDPKNNKNNKNNKKDKKESISDRPIFGTGPFDVSDHYYGNIGFF